MDRGRFNYFTWGCYRKYAIIGADSLVNKDVPDYAVVVGNPAKIIKYLEPEKLKKSN